MKRPMYHALEINKANEELAAENLRLLEQIKELETARESDLAFFGATLEEDGGLHIDMKKYHAAHICKEHQWLPKEERLIEDRCPICIKSQIDDLERQLAEVRSPSTTPTDLTEQARRLVEGATIVCWKDHNDRYHVSDEVVERVASALDEAATQGQAVGIERAAEQAETLRDGNAEYAGNASIASAIRLLSPDPDYITRVCNEAATAALEQGVTPEVARKLLHMRDAIAKEDYREAWHDLYSIANPKFDSYEPWAELERIAAIADDKG